MSKTFGIDISAWQKDFDFRRAKQEGVHFVILRAMYGNTKDSEFEHHYEKARENGLDIGVYQWGKATNVDEAREEARILVEKCLQNKKFEYPIYYDVEDSLILNQGLEKATRIVSAWCEKIEEMGYFAGIYMNQNCYDNKVKGYELAKKYSQWRAKWTTEKNQPLNVGMWQFGGEKNFIRSNQIAGVVCDQNYAFEDYPRLIKEKGFNGYQASNQNIKYYTVKKGDTIYMGNNEY